MLTTRYILLFRWLSNPRAPGSMRIWNIVFLELAATLVQNLWSLTNKCFINAVVSIWFTQVHLIIPLFLAFNIFNIDHFYQGHTNAISDDRSSIGGLSARQSDGAGAGAARLVPTPSPSLEMPEAVEDSFPTRVVCGKFILAAVMKNRL